jgi:antitoxin ParD1/3/4
MATMNISLPDSLRDFVESRVNEGGYSTASEYFRDLVRSDQKRESQQRLEALLLEGLESPAHELTSADWDHIRQEVRRKLHEPTK